MGNDEVNLIDPGENYGWPEVEGEDHGPYAAPVAVFSPAVAPAGAMFYDSALIPQWRGSFFFATLRGAHLHRMVFDPDDPRRVIETERLYDGEYGRLRDVVQGPDGGLYVTTSNRDGRGNPDPRDDRVLRIGPAGERPLLYPDLRTLSPADLRLEATTDGDDGEASVYRLHFATTIWNAGEGPLEERAVSEDASDVAQRIYDAQGTFVERPSGRLEYDSEHGHWHFENFARYELWTNEAHDAWLATGRSHGGPEWQRHKSGFCRMATTFCGRWPIP